MGHVSKTKTEEYRWRVDSNERGWRDFNDEENRMLNREFIKFKNGAQNFKEFSIGNGKIDFEKMVQIFKSSDGDEKSTDTSSGYEEKEIQRLIQTKNRQLILTQEDLDDAAMYSDFIYDGKHNFGEKLYGEIHEPEFFSHVRWMVSREVKTATIYVTFRGTADSVDVTTDLALHPLNIPFANFDLHVVSGPFVAIAESLRVITKRVSSLLKEDKGRFNRVIFTGHSLGGGFALIAHLYFMLCQLNKINDAKLDISEEERLLLNQVQTATITFGALQAFNYKPDEPIWRELNKRTLCVVNDKDIVPKVPGITLKRLVEHLDKFAVTQIDEICGIAGFFVRKFKLRDIRKAMDFLKDWLKMIVDREPRFYGAIGTQLILYREREDRWRHKIISAAYRRQWLFETQQNFEVTAEELINAHRMDNYEKAMHNLDRTFEIQLSAEIQSNFVLKKDHDLYVKEYFEEPTENPERQLSIGEWFRKPTISEYSAFKANDDARALEECFRKSPQNPKNIIKIFVNRSIRQRNLIVKSYKKLFGKDFVADLAKVKSTSQQLFDGLQHLLKTRAEYDAFWCHKALNYTWGYDQKLLGSILFTRTNKQLKEIIKAYDRLYSHSLLEKINKKTGPWIGRSVTQIQQIYRDILNLRRPEDNHVSRDYAKTQAKLLCDFEEYEHPKYLSQKRKRDVIEVFTKVSFRQLSMIRSEYARISEKRNIFGVINNVFGKDVRIAVDIMKEFAVDKDHFFCQNDAGKLKMAKRY